MASNCPYWKVGNCEPPHATSIHSCSYIATDYAECAVHQYTIAKEGDASTAQALRSAGVLSPFGTTIVVSESPKPPSSLPVKDIHGGFPLDHGYSRLKIQALRPELELNGPLVCTICGMPVSDNACFKKQIYPLSYHPLEKKITVVARLCNEHDCLEGNLSNYIRIRNDRVYSTVGYWLLEIGNPEVAVQYQQSINAEMEALATYMEEQSKKVWFGKKKYQALRIVVLGGRVKSIVRLKPGDEEWVGWEYLT